MSSCTRNIEGILIMQEGLLINGFERKLSLAERLEESFSIYTERYKSRPDFIEVNATNYLESGNTPLEIHGILITPSVHCLYGHIFIGANLPDPKPRMKTIW